MSISPYAVNGREKPPKNNANLDLDKMNECSRKNVENMFENDIEFWKLRNSNRMKSGIFFCFSISMTNLVKILY